MDLKDLEKLAKFYDVPPAALLEAPPGSEELLRLRRAAHVLRSMPGDAADDWLRMGERLQRPPEKSS